MNKRNYKIVRLYLIALICIAFYFFLENSVVITNLVEKMSDFRYRGFATFLLTGLLKYGLLVIGISIIIILTFLLIREKTKKIE
jgi:hypothetical protein